MTVSLGEWSWGSPDSLTTLLLLVLLVFLVISQWRIRQRLRKNRAAEHSGIRYPLVSTLNLLAFLAVVLLIAPPHRDHAADKAITLITEGFPADAAQTLPDIGVYATADALINISAPDQFNVLASAGQLPLRHADLNTLDILGHGLSETDWEEFPESVSVRYTPSRISGPVSPQWSRRLILGENLAITGRVAWEQPQEILTLQLLDPAGIVMDEANARDGQAFSLNAVPKAPGQFLYQLRLSDGEGRIVEEKVPVSLQPATGTRIVVIQSAPSYDTRQLANWAGDNGSEMVILTEISQDRTLQQAINLPEKANFEFTAALFDSSDLAIVDGRSWVGFSAAQRALVLNAVNRGLGLLINADETLANELRSDNGLQLDDFRLAPFTGTREPEWIRWAGGAADSPLPVLPYVLSSAHAQWLSVSENGQVIEAYVSSGQGRIALSLLRERHAWLTSDDASAWSRYWANVLTTVSRPQDNAAWLNPDHRIIAQSGERQWLCAKGQGPLGTSAADDEGREIPLLLQPGKAQWPAQCTSLWLPSSGWQTLDLIDQQNGNLLDSLSMYVFEKQDWSAARFEARRAATMRRATLSANTERESVGVSTPLSLIWPFLLLLTFTGLLWLERKLDDEV